MLKLIVKLHYLEENMKNFKKLLGTVKINKCKIFIGIMFFLIGNIVSFSIPIFAKNMIDKNLTVKNILILVSVVLFSVSSMVIGSYIFNKTVINWVYFIRKNIVNDMLSIKINAVSKKISSKFSSEIMNYTEEIKNLFVSTLRSSISVFVSFASITLLLVISFKLTLVLVFLLLLLILIVSPFTSLSAKAYNKNQENVTSTIGYLTHIISEIKFIKSYNAYEDENSQFDKLNTHTKNISLKLCKVDASIEPVITVSFIGILFLIFLTGSILISKGELTLGGLIAFCLYVFQILTPLVNISNFFKNITSLDNFSKNIIEIFELEKEKTDGKKVGNLLENSKINFKDVCFGYDKNNNILENFNLEIFPKESIAIVGPSGAGKTTILNLLERFYDVDQGSIFIDNENIKNFNLNDLRNKITYVQQNNSFINASILDNLLYGQSKVTSSEQINNALKLSGSEFTNNLPEKLDTIIDPNGSNFSGGELQRLMLARALVKNADVLLLDEITSNLDSESEMIIKNTLSLIKNKKTIIIIAHRLSTVKFVDRIIFLENGKITGMGKHEELLKTHDLYKTYVENQLI